MFCTDIAPPIFLIFSEYSDHLLYYSHIPTALIALVVGIFVFYSNKNHRAAKLLLAIAILFSIWSFFDLILWANIDSRRIMLVWSLINLAEMLVSVFTLYFAYVFLEGKDVSFRLKLFFGSLLLIYLVFIPTKLNISGFNLVNCEAQQGVMRSYFYFLEALFSVWLFVYLFRKIKNANKGRERKRIAYFSAGIVFFLLSFSGANIISSITMHWEILHYGLFGMVVFMIFLGLLIVRFKAFNIKILGVQALIACLVFLIGSLLFYVQSSGGRVLICINLLLVLFFGWQLIRSVKREVEGKKELEILASKLKRANSRLKKLDQAKTEFLSIASHQLRTPLTAIKGYLSLVDEGLYGEVSREVKEVLGKIHISNERLINLVEDLLNISRIETGRMQYNFGQYQVCEDIVGELKDSFDLRAKEKGLTLTFNRPKVPVSKTKMDRNKIREVLSNIIDNAIKYTDNGGVEMKVRESRGKIRISVTDTGIGIPKTEMPYLFKKFSRGKDTKRLNADGTGLGIYLAKKIIKDHDGKIYIRSEGKGKGSTFVIELPIVVSESDNS